MMEKWCLTSDSLTNKNDGKKTTQSCLLCSRDVLMGKKATKIVVSKSTRAKDGRSYRLVIFELLPEDISDPPFKPLEGPPQFSLGGVRMANMTPARWHGNASRLRCDRVGQHKIHDVSAAAMLRTTKPSGGNERKFLWHAMSNMGEVLISSLLTTWELFWGVSFQNFPSKSLKYPAFDIFSLKTQQNISFHQLPMDQISSGLSCWLPWTSSAAASCASELDQLCCSRGEPNCLEL